MQRLLLGVGLALATLGCSGSGADAGLPLSTRSGEARRRFAEGVASFDRLRMEDARQAFLKATQADPEFALAWAYLASSMNSTGDVAGARAKADELRHKASAAEQALVEAHAAWGRYERRRALEALGRAADAAPRSRQVRLEHGVLARQLGRHEQAAADLRQVLEIDPRFAFAGAHLAPALAKAGHADEARAAAADLVRALPREPLAHVGAGDVRRDLGECEAAIEEYSKALAVDPGLVPAYEGRAYCHRFREDFGAARADYTKAFERTAALPDAAYKDLFLDWTKAEDIHSSIALTLLLEGRWDEALSAARDTVEYCERVRPQNAVFFHDALGRMYLEDGRLEESLQAYQAGQESVRRNELSYNDSQLWAGRYVHAKGRIHARARRFREAAAEADRLRQMIEYAGADGEPYRQSLHYLLGYIALEKREPRRAVQELEQADQDDPFILWLLARAYRDAGDEAAASVLISKLKGIRGGGFRYALVRRDVMAWPAAPKAAPALP